MRRTREMPAGVACPFCRKGQMELLADGEEDRISALPDEILLQILARLGCARTAAGTGLLARRWCGLWALLPKLTFHWIAPDSLDAALALLPRPAPSLSLLEIHDFDRRIEPARLSSFLGAAAALAPAELVFHVTGGILRGPVELPSFDRTVSIKLDIYAVGFTLPPAGGFPALESLHLDNCSIDLSDLLPRCPRLRILWIPFWHSDSVMVSSPSLEEFGVIANFQIRHLEIVAPALKKLYLDANHGINEDCSLSFTAPAVEDLTWKFESKAISYSFGVIWRMWSLTHEFTKIAKNSEKASLLSQHCPQVHVLSLNLETDHCLGDPSKSFEEEISRFQVCNFSILELDLTPRGHVYGAIVLHLLGFCTSIQRLKVTLSEEVMRDICSVNRRCDKPDNCWRCRCDKPNNWRSQSISLIDLKEVEIRLFRGEDHEVDLLKVLLRCATMLERVTLIFSRKFSPSDSGRMQIDGILKAYPSVKCNIYP